MKDLLNKKLIVLILLAVIGFAVYYNSLKNGFHFDDTHHIAGNNYIKSLTNIPRFFIDINTFSANREIAHYRPVLMVTHAFNYAVGGLSPIGYHLVNLAFHVGSAFLIFLILNVMLEGRGQNHRTAFIASLAAGLIFIVHPFNTEVINYISARSSVMSGFFYLLAFYWWVKFRVQHRKVFYIASLTAFAVGILTKESLITFPLMIWLYDIIFAARQTGGPGKRGFTLSDYIKQGTSYVPYIVFVISPYLLLRSFLIKSALSARAPRGYYENLLLQVKVLVKYIYLLFLPYGLSIEHDISEVSSIGNVNVLGSIVIVIMLFGIAIFLLKSKIPDSRIISFSIFWFFITMLPTTIMPLNAPLQENRGYIAGAGFAVFLGIIISRFSIRSTRSDYLKKIALIIIMVLYSVASIERNTVWKNDITLWLDAIEKSPMSSRAHNNLGQTLYNNFRLTYLAIEEYKKAIEFKNNNYIAMNNLGSIYLEKGRLDLALAEFRNAVNADPNYIKGHMNLARVYVKMGKWNEARNESETVIKLGEFFRQEDENTAEARRYLKWLGGTITSSSDVPVPPGQEFYLPP